MRKYIVFLLFLLSFPEAYSQYLIRRGIVEPQAPDSIDLAYYAPKKGWAAAAQVAGLNVAVWAFDRYAIKGHYAYISLETMGNNLKHGFVWDNDQMSTNMFMHPYHGSLYYNSARSRGYNYWESAGFAFGGSLMWELFMENEYPSINDVIATPVGGAILGEVLYRASDLVLDDRKRGTSRLGSELAGLAISPMRGLTRVINGDAWKKRSTSGRQFGTPSLSIDLSVGARALEIKDNLLDRGTGGAITFALEYGDRFKHEGIKPFDYLNIRAHMNIQKSQPVLGQINVLARLWGADLMDKPKDYLGLGIYQYFDYYDSDTISAVSNVTPYKFGAPAAFGVGLVHKGSHARNWNLDSHFHLTGILLGASLSDYYVMDNRNYNLGSGFGFKFGANLVYKNKFGIGLTSETYNLYTWKGYNPEVDLSQLNPKDVNIQGDRSKAVFSVLRIKAELKLKDNWFLTSIGSWFYRETTYWQRPDFKDVYSSTGESLLLLTYKF